MSYSTDLREKALEYRTAHTQAETSETFGISVSAVKTWQKLQKEQGNLEKKELERKGRKIKKEALEKDVEEYPDDFNYERAARFRCSAEAIREAMKRHKLTRKKKKPNTANGTKRSVRST
jgi:transposase